MFLFWEVEKLGFYGSEPFLRGDSWGSTPLVCFWRQVLSYLYFTPEMSENGTGRALHSPSSTGYRQFNRTGCHISFSILSNIVTIRKLPEVNQFISQSHNLNTDNAPCIWPHFGKKDTQILWEEALGHWGEHAGQPWPWRAEGGLEGGCREGRGRPQSTAPSHKRSQFLASDVA